jgi:hypothetical protein
MKSKRAAKNLLSLLTTITVSLLFVLCFLTGPVLSADKPIELRFTSIVNSLHSDFKSFQRFGD